MSDERWKKDVADIKNKVTNPSIIKEAFDESDLVTDVYTVTKTYDGAMGIGITNNNTDNPLTVTINSIPIIIGKTKSFYGVFEAFESLSVTGTNIDFDAFIEG